MRAFIPQDVLSTVKLADPRISPNGKRVAFTAVSMDAEKNEYKSQIWIAPCDFELKVKRANDVIKVSGNPTARPFTSGEHKESRPRWSPDGASLAYVGHRADLGSELYVIPCDGGEAAEITQMPEEIEELEWSPNGSRIAFIARDQDKSMYEADKPKDQAAKRITRLVYRLDNVGWTAGRTRQLFVVNKAGGEPRKLTSGDSEMGGISWSPDSKAIAFSSGAHKTWDFDFFTDLYVVPVGGGKPKKLTKTASGHSSPSCGPDGRLIAFRWVPDPIDGPYNARIGVLDIKSGKTKILTEKLDRQTNTFPPVREPLWVGDDLWFAAEDSGNVHVYKVAASGKGKPKLVVGDEQSITGMDHCAGVVALTTTAPTTVSNLILITPSTKKAEKQFAITYGPMPFVDDLPTRLSRDIELVSPIRFTATSKDGTEVEAWIMRPPGFKSGKKYPALLNIHGGPFTQYGNKFFDDFQVYAGAGYAVIYSNPRGSSGYSQEWGRAVKGPKTADKGPGWGSVDFEDLMAVTDQAIKQFPFIDPKRVGVMGGSYGGYMTSWIIGHTDRFKAAISERAVNNMYTMAYTSDIGAYFRAELGPLYFDDPEEYLRVSPITYVRDIKTPVLILHSENDLRCPIEQAEQLFSALKLLGREVEFVRFPGSSHELSRSGSPKQRVERFEIILDWFGRKL